MKTGYFEKYYMCLENLNMYYKVHKKFCKQYVLLFRCLESNLHEY